MADASDRDRATARARQYFDTHADGYDEEMRVAERRLLGEQRTWATSRASGAVLELAVGTGLNLPLYPAAVHHVLGIDLSAAMLDRARARVRDLGLGERVALRQGDVQRLDLPGGSVDTVVATYALCTVPDPGAALLEARRVLRPGGRLVLVEHGPAASRWIRAVQRVLDPLAVRFQADHLLREPRRLAADAGFVVEHADQVGTGGLAHRVDARRPG
ncbi:class I SAM-dependent methyltransferase [Cellulomonas cellasea]|uniref:Ubiquinone/menaquinone biosynthesis C-methylase UbiE n=1 Tax=Cellulomonas cellasea TaxID=43670 RepID=A0A7W4UHM8_9CELL|nr:class I SAM-dependent methyltransferase [Cellulomonas cellasea]MBB2924313.1 ubiquinone/menaquinone biosynthesis C-methylase UbiE [Cellulomonas cellasea]